MTDPRSIRPRIALIFVLIVTTVLTVTGAWNYFSVKAEREQQLAAELDNMMARLQSSLPPAVWDYNDPQVTKTVNSEMGAAFVLGIDVAAREKTVFSVGRDGQSLVPNVPVPGADVVRKAPLIFTYQGKQLDLGTVTVYASRQAIVEHQRHDLYSLIASIVITNVVLVSALYFALRVLVLMPLERLQLDVSALEEGRRALPETAVAEAASEAPPGQRGDNEIERLSSSFSRMADKLRAQLDALHERESYLRLLLDTLAEGLVVRGRKHEVFDYNQSILSLFALPAASLDKRRNGGDGPDNAGRFFRPDGREYVGDELPSRRALLSGTPIRGELMRVLREDGAEFWATVNATPLRREGDSDAYAVVVAFNDVTPFVDAEQELNTLNEDLEQRVQTRTSQLRAALEDVERASRAKSEFLSSMSHELRTPLNGILGFAQLLAMADPPLSEAEKRKVDQIETAGWHLLGLIDEVLDLARIESGATDIEMEPVKAQAVVDETLELVRAMAREKGVTLVALPATRLASATATATATIATSLERSTEPPIEESPWVHADRRRLIQVLMNLLSNAIKYNRPHGVVTVAVRRVSTARAVISVTDTGRGFTAEELAVLYQPFTRFKKKGDTIQGTGIGLVITRNLVELMGGKLAVTSMPDEGSTFEVELECAEAPGNGPAPRHDAQPHDPSTTHKGDRPEKIVPSEDTRHVLYVEDNPANVELFRQIVAMRPDYRLTVATDGLSGLALIRAQIPDLAIVDIDLPGIDGVEVCRRLRADSATREMALVALSASAMPDDIDRALGAGFDLYLTKPIDVIRMLAEMERLLFTRKGTR